MDINNEIPKEIHKINKILKRADFEPLTIGEQALKDCHLTSKEALLIANWQELSGLTFILNANHLPIKSGHVSDMTPFALATAAANHDIPNYVLVREAIGKSKNDVKAKFEIIANAIRWFEFNKENAEKTKKKRRRFIDNILLGMQVKDFISELGHIHAQNISPYQLYHIGIANYWSQKNHQTRDPFLSGYVIKQKIFFKPWLIITNDGTKGYHFVHGRNQQQLITYLLHSHYLKNYALQFHFNMQLSLGWDKVLNKQLELGQHISDALHSSLSAYQEMSEIKLKKNKLSHYFLSLKNAMSSNRQNANQSS